MKPRVHFSVSTYHTLYPPSLPKISLSLSLPTSLSLSLNLSISRYLFFLLTLHITYNSRVEQKKKDHTNLPPVCSIFGPRFHFALLVEAVSLFASFLGRGRILTAMAPSGTPQPTVEEEITDGMGSAASLYWLTKSAAAELTPKKAAVMEPPPKKAAAPKAMTGSAWLGPPPPKVTQVLPEGFKAPPPEAVAAAAVFFPAAAEVLYKEPPTSKPMHAGYDPMHAPMKALPEEPPPEIHHPAAVAKKGPPVLPQAKKAAPQYHLDQLNAITICFADAFPSKAPGGKKAPPPLPEASKAAVAKMLAKGPPPLDVPTPPSKAAVAKVKFAPVPAPPAKAPPPLNVPTPPSKAAVAKVTFAPVPAPNPVRSAPLSAYLRNRYPMAAGSNLLIPSSSQRCPGLDPNSLLELCCINRVETYCDLFGYHYKCLLTVFPPMELFTKTPVAVRTCEADRYFFIAGGIGGARWQDSRNFIALKLPCESHAVNYVMREMQRLLDAPTLLWPWSEQVVIPRVLPRKAPPPEASVASTHIDPYSESESESGTETPDLAEPPVAWLWDEAVVVRSNTRRGDIWEDAAAFARAQLGRDEVSRHETIAFYYLLVRQRDFHYQMRLRIPFRRWAAAANTDYIYPDGDVSYLCEMARFRSARWYLATGTRHSWPRQQPWQFMQMTRRYPAAVAQGQFFWHVSHRFRYRVMMGNWAAVAIEAGAIRRALRLAHHPLSRGGRLGETCGREVQRFLGVAPSPISV